MTTLLPSASSALALPAEGPHRRLPRRPGHTRPAAFYDNFDALTLFYDCFEAARNGRVLLVGPPPRNLLPLFRRARFAALPSGAQLGVAFHRSQSVMLTVLDGVPGGTTSIGIELGGLRAELPVQPNSAAQLSGRRVLFTMSKDNEPGWIAEWARYHARVQGADAVILFDNGSGRHPPAEALAALQSVPELAAIAVLSWPQIYGAPDPAVLNNPFYTHFLQIGAMSVALRRFAADAAGLLNCDIDELVATPPGETVFGRVAASHHGLVVMRGQYVEAVPTHDAPAGHRLHHHFASRLKDTRARFSAQKKWALDPRRPWVARPETFPYMHWIEGRPLFSKTQDEDVFYWHFRGISTDWKDRRSETAHLDPADLEADPRWLAAMAPLCADAD